MAEDLRLAIQREIIIGNSNEEPSEKIAARVLALLDWHPVDTAPEDGSQILVAWRGPAQRLGAEFAEVDDVWLTTVIFFHDGDWQLVETDTHAFDNIFTEPFELWKPIELPKDEEEDRDAFHH